MEQEGAKGKRGRYVNPIYSLAFLRTSSSHRWLRNKSVSWYVIQGRIYFTTDWWAEKYHFSTSWKYDEQTVCRPCVCQRWGLVAAGFDGGNDRQWIWDFIEGRFAMVKRCIETERWREDCLDIKCISILHYKIIINKKSKKNLYLFDDISIFRRQMGRIYSMKFVKKWSGVAFEWTVFSKEILKQRKILFFETFSLKNERKNSMAFYLFICNENVNTHSFFFNIHHSSSSFSNI